MTQSTDPAVITEVDPHDDDALRAWHRTLTEAASAGRDHPVISTYQEMAVSLREPSRFNRQVAYSALVAGAPAGVLLLEFPLTENTGTAFVELGVAVAHRRRGHGAALFEHARTLAAAEGRHRLLAEVCLPRGRTTGDWPGTRFAERHGMLSKHVEERFMLDLPLPTDLLDELEARPVGTGYTTRTWVGSSPDELAEAFAGLHTAMAVDVPIGELDYEPEVWDVARLRDSEQRSAARGFTLITTVALAPGGEPAGYSQLAVPEHQPETVYQEDTLVLRAHRGNALGTRLKVANLRVLAERFPGRRSLHTWMSTSNPAMRTVNAGFGFRAVEAMHEYQLG